MQSCFEQDTRGGRGGGGGGELDGVPRGGAPPLITFSIWVCTGSSPSPHYILHMGVYWLLPLPSLHSPYGWVLAHPPPLITFSIWVGTGSSPSPHYILHMGGYWLLMIWTCEDGWSGKRGRGLFYYIQHNYVTHNFSNAWS